MSVHYRLHSLTKGGRKLVAYSIVTMTKPNPPYISMDKRIKRVNALFISKILKNACTHYCSRSCDVHKHSKTGEVGAIALHHSVVPLLCDLNCSHSLSRPTTTANSWGEQRIQTVTISGGLLLFYPHCQFKSWCWPSLGGEIVHYVFWYAKLYRVWLILHANS